MRQIHKNYNFLQFTQTESNGGVGACHLVLVCASDGEASTQVSHVFTESVAVQVSTKFAERAVGPDSRTCIFAGHDPPAGKVGVLEEPCLVSTNIFALLLHLLCTVVVREIDVPIESKLLIFLVKLKLGI